MTRGNKKTKKIVRLADLKKMACRGVLLSPTTRSVTTTTTTTTDAAAATDDDDDDDAESF